MQPMHHKNKFVSPDSVRTASRIMDACCPSREAGFSLIELMVSVLIGLVLLAGLMSNFITQSRVEDMQANYTQRMGDLHLVSQLMQHELRTSQTANLTWASNILSYKDVDGNQGSFQFFKTTSGSHDPGSICWIRPTYANCDELIRDLNTTAGMDVTLDASGVIHTVALKMDYQNNRHQTSSIDVAFKIWPRN